MSDKTRNLSNGVELAPNRALNSEQPPEAGTCLSGKQEHYLKRELVSEQVKWEINKLNSPTALKRFGAPFKSDVGEVSPLQSEFPLLRYIFVHHVRHFPFLDKAKEKEFWQDKLQTFLESFASQDISSSEDRLEETKRRKIAIKCQKLIELMIVSGVRTSSGFEERIRFSEFDLVDSNAIDTGVMHSLPEGNSINGWDVNVACVRVKMVRRKIRSHPHAEFILRVKRTGEKQHFIGRRYGDFVELHKALRFELPGRVLPPVPRKNTSDSTIAHCASPTTSNDTDEASSISSGSTKRTTPHNSPDLSESPSQRLSMSATLNDLRQGAWALPSRLSPRVPHVERMASIVAQHRSEQAVTLWRESQRVSLRAFMRTLLHNSDIAKTRAILTFLTTNPLSPTEADWTDMNDRMAADDRRVKEQRQFYEIARRRAAELDVYMEDFRRDIVEKNGLTILFQEIREKKSIGDLSIQYRKFAEWLRIEVAATLYHLFLAEDNSLELFAQAKRIHSLVPYTIVKNVLRIANPAAVMSAVLDVFLAQPFGAKSLLQRMFSLTLNEGIKSVQKTIDALVEDINDPVLTAKLIHYAEAGAEVKDGIRMEAASDGNDLVVAILRTESLEPQLTDEQTERVVNAFVAFNYAVEHVDDELKQGAQLYSYLKQLLKLCTRQRDKIMMLGLIEQPVTLQLFKDVFTIFYDPLARVYKSANIYNSVTDFADFVNDAVRVIGKCRDEEISADPNQTVQTFIDLCARHEHNFYTFIHEVHKHDNGLFAQLMGWIEGILDFLRHGPTNGTLDINALFEGAVSSGAVDRDRVIGEINRLIAWQEARKRWHYNKTRQKMAAEGQANTDVITGITAFIPADFGLDKTDLEDMDYDAQDGYSGSDADLDATDDLDPIESERQHRAKRQDNLRRRAGEPAKPDVSEVYKLKENFLVMLREVLAQ